MNLDLFPTVSEDQVLAEVLAYEKHIRGQYDYRIDIEPMPTPRPRSRVMTKRGGQTVAPYVLIYHDSDYTKYMENIVWKLKNVRLKLKPGDYSMLFVTFYIPFPKSTPKKLVVNGAKHRKKPDYDNFIKGFQDSLEKAGIIVGDGQLSDGAIKKRYTTEERGYIAFNLV